MPTVLRSGPYRFHFFMGDRLEPRHIHVARGGADAKFWLDPDVSLAHSRGYPKPEIRTIESLIRGNLQVLRDAWDDVFNP